MGFLHVSWLFFGAAHGKGAADGVRSTLKRDADRLVKLGPDAKTFYNELKQ